MENKQNDNSIYTQYNPMQPTDKGILLAPQGTVYNLGTPDLSDSLKGEIIRSTGLADAIRDLPLISVETVLLFARQRNKPISVATCEFFLAQQEALGNIIQQEDDNGRKFWIRSKLFNDTHPVSKVLRDAKATVANLKAKGFTE